MRAILLIAALTAAAPASAEVVQSTANGFEVRHSVPLVVTPMQAWAALGRVGGWWSAEHTYSGDAANLSLDLRAGGCFCERIPKTGGGIEHLRVTYADPGKRLVLTGSLGPLLYEATAGVMDIRIEPVAGGSRVTINYRVAGFANGGGDKMAPVVDQMLGDQMKRFRAYASASARKRT